MAAESSISDSAELAVARNLLRPGLTSGHFVLDFRQTFAFTHSILVENLQTRCFPSHSWLSPFVFGIHCFCRDAGDGDGIDFMDWAIWQIKLFTVRVPPIKCSWHDTQPAAGHLQLRPRQECHLGGSFTERFLTSADLFYRSKQGAKVSMSIAKHNWTQTRNQILWLRLFLPCKLYKLHNSFEHFYGMS